MEPIEQESIIQDEDDCLIENDEDMYDLENYMISDMLFVIFIIPN